MIDKVIVLGLIDVRDLEEVGIGPLMEELSLDEETAQKVVEKCAAEAKIVAVEQEAKKIADASAKAAVAASQAADKAALLALGDLAAPAEEKMPGALESAPGGAPEVIVHADTITAGEGEELSVEEQAIHGIDESGDVTPESSAPVDEEDDETAALAEGREAPPSEDPNKL
jgi:hypothetical protein